MPDLTTNTTNTAKTPDNAILFLLQNLDAGEVIDEGSRQLRELVTMVNRRDGAGSLTIKINVKPFKAGAMIFTAEVTSKAPKEEPASSLFYAAEDGALSRNDPRQRELKLEAVEKTDENGDPVEDPRSGKLAKRGAW